MGKRLQLRLLSCLRLLGASLASAPATARHLLTFSSSSSFSLGRPLAENGRKRAMSSIILSFFPTCAKELWTVWGSHGSTILWSSMVFYGLLWSSMVFYGLLWSSMVFYGLLWSSMVFYGLLWSTMVYWNVCGILLLCEIAVRAFAAWILRRKLLHRGEIGNVPRGIW